MKKSRIKQIIKEVLLEEKGYSNYIPGGETSGLDKKTLDNILLKIAKGERPTEQEQSVARGNRILDKSDPENVKKILGGEGLGEIKVNNPNKTKEELAQLVSDNFSTLDFVDFYDYNIDFSKLIYPKSYEKLSQNELNILYQITLDQLGNNEVGRMQELAGIKSNNLKQDIEQFWGTLLDDDSQREDDFDYTPIEWDTQFFIEEYPEYDGREEEINSIVKELGLI